MGAFSKAVLFAAASGLGCSDFLSVEHRGAIDGRDLDPVHDAAVFANSVQQNFAAVYPSVIVAQAWFTGEAIPADVSSDPHEFARRAVSQRNGVLLGVWSELSVVRETADRLLESLSRAQASSSAHAARASLFGGFAYLFMAESFCEITVKGRRMSALAALDTARSRFVHAEAVATGPDAEMIRNAARVGQARALLQAGRAADAAQVAATVAPGFDFTLPYAHDPAYLLRLGNRIWYYSAIRSIIAVAPAYRGLGDARVAVAAPSAEMPPFDGLTEYWTQRKYVGFDAPIRLASRLEADYIQAEARGPAQMLALIQARRATNGLPPYAGPADEVDLLRELMEQRRRDFFLEGKRMGELRRHPAAVPAVPVTGASYVKPAYGPVGSQTCWPLPADEPSTG